MTVIPLNRYRPHVVELEAFSRAVVSILAIRRTSSRPTVGFGSKRAIGTSLMERNSAIYDAIKRQNLSIAAYDRILSAVRDNNAVRERVRSRITRLLSVERQTAAAVEAEIPQSASAARNMPIAVLVGRETLFLSGLAALLGAADFEIAACVADEIFIDPETQPDIIILERSGTRATDCGVIRKLVDGNPKAAVILIGSPVDFDAVRELLAAGVRGYLSMALSPEALVLSVRLAALGEIVYPSSIAEYLERGLERVTRIEESTVRKYSLTEVEVRILECLVDGCSNKEIAVRLELTERAVKVIVKRLLRRLGFQNRTQAAIWTAQNSLSAFRRPAMR